MEQSTFNSSLYAAIVSEPGANGLSFLCRDLPSTSPLPTYNCTNAIYIRNLPASLAVAGQVVTFTGWKDNGQPLLFSSVNHAHELDVQGIRAAD